MSAVARRYAKALFDLASEAGLREEVAEELDRLRSLVTSTELSPIWNNPRLGVDQRRALARLLQEQLGLSELVGRFLQYLAEVRRLRELEAIQRCFQQLLDESLGRTRARLRCAQGLDDATVARIASAFSQLTGKEVLADVQVEPELLGGLIVEVEGKVFDGSVRSQLARMTARLMGSAAN